MSHQFFKYHGTGNDFIIMDNRQLIFDKNNTKLIAELCDRRFGIGADGLILLELSSNADFTMVYFNSDGRTSSMCGNGGRCIVHFANYLDLIKDKTTFEAIDGLHDAVIENGLVHLKMQNVTDIRQYNDYVVLDTGSPHYVQHLADVETIDVLNEGRQIRNSAPFKTNGINVNFVAANEQDKYAVRTYERGVEDETYSCGTGVTAVALAMHYIGETEKNLIAIQTKGGALSVKFEVQNGHYHNIWLIGPATQVYTGEITW